MSTPTKKKETLRTELRNRRRELFKSADPKTFKALADNFFRALPSLFNPSTVAGYYPLGSEINPLPLLEALEQVGTQVALPVVVKENAPLEFRFFKKGDKLKEGLEGAMEPLKTAKTTNPDIVLVPLLGFDETGNRIGQGKGYYDRTLGALRKERAVLAIGLAFEGQREKALPFEAHDQDLDAVITEARCWVFRSGKAA